MNFLLPISESTQVGEARRIAQVEAEALGFNETERGRIALLVSEAGHNLVKHAGGGELILQKVVRGERVGFELLSIDRGPGMSDIGKCLRDGFSTTGTQGTGLGALSRLADDFDLYSQRDEGVVLLARIWKGNAQDPLPFDQTLGSVSFSYPGEEISGDAFSSWVEDDRSLYIVADGLGHGPKAAEASNEAIAVFQSNPKLAPRELMEKIHLALLKTRGAAVAIAEIRPSAKQLTYIGIGNIVGKIFKNEEFLGLISHDGISGYLQPRFREYVYPWEASDVLIMHSDGFSSRALPHLTSAIKAHSPSVIAGLLVRDCKRLRDDQTAVVVKGSQGRH